MAAQLWSNLTSPIEREPAAAVVAATFLVTLDLMLGRHDTQHLTLGAMAIEETVQAVGLNRCSQEGNQHHQDPEPTWYLAQLPLKSRYLWVPDIY